MIVYTGGTFDLFHSGHVRFLKQCWFLARLSVAFDQNPHNEVVVSLNTDEFIRDFKGRAPVYTYEERKALLLGCKYVSKVVPNTRGQDSKPAILSVRPNIIAIGSDWAKKDYYAQMSFTQQWLDEANIQLVYLPYTEGISTTDLKKRLGI